MNWVRIPLPFWSISKWENEPFLERTSWKCELSSRSFLVFRRTRTKLSARRRFRMKLTSSLFDTDFLKVLEWSRKYGLRVNLDLHSVPGSQKYALSPLFLPSFALLSRTYTDTIERLRVVAGIIPGNGVRSTGYIPRWVSRTLNEVSIISGRSPNS